MVRARAIDALATSFCVVFILRFLFVFLDGLGLVGPFEWVLLRCWRNVTRKSEESASGPSPVTSDHSSHPPIPAIHAEDL